MTVRQLQQQLLEAQSVATHLRSAADVHKAQSASQVNLCAALHHIVGMYAPTNLHVEGEEEGGGGACMHWSRICKSVLQLCPIALHCGYSNMHDNASQLFSWQNLRPSEGHAA